MPLRSISVNVGPTNMVHLAGRVMGMPGASTNRILEAAIRAYNGEDRASIIRKMSGNTRHNLKDGGKKLAKIDDELLTGISNISEAGRIGLFLLMYEDMSREEAEELARDRVKRGGRKPGSKNKPKAA